jgi:hypothetical protein
VRALPEVPMQHCCRVFISLRRPPLATHRRTAPAKTQLRKRITDLRPNSEDDSSLHACHAGTAIEDAPVLRRYQDLPPCSRIDRGGEYRCGSQRVKLAGGDAHPAQCYCFGGGRTTALSVRFASTGRLLRPHLRPWSRSYRWRRTSRGSELSRSAAALLCERSGTPGGMAQATERKTDRTYNGVKVHYMTVNAGDLRIVVGAQLSLENCLEAGVCCTPDCRTFMSQSFESHYVG